MYLSDKRSKLIITVGPSSDNYKVMRDLIVAGATCVRANFSHGDHEEQARKFAIAKQISKDLNVPISLLLDTKGPEIRIGKMAQGAVEIRRGSILRIDCDPQAYLNKIGTQEEISVSYEMQHDLKIGQTILIDDGKLVVTVQKIKGAIITTEPRNSHLLRSNKRINLPGIDFSLPFLSERDKKDIIFGIQLGVNYIAASFVNTKANVLELRKLLDDNGGFKIKIISKIESRLGIQNIDEIIDVSDGVMVARGDLGLEIAYYDVPFYQKQIIRKCRNVGKPVIVATQMLDSMESNTQPTRAEVTDVYFATELGADATMLSGESAQGLFPEEAVKVMSQINIRAEKEFYSKLYYEEQLEENKKTLTKDFRSSIAIRVADKVKEGEFAFILVLSDTGKLLERIAKLRPNAPIIGLLKDADLINSFGITHSVFIVPDSPQIYEECRKNPKFAIAKLEAYGAKKGDRILIAHNDEFEEVIL